MNVSMFNEKGQVRERLAPRWIERVLFVAFGVSVSLQIAIVALLSVLLARG